MSKKRFANVWDAIEDTPAQAENLKLRSALIMALKDHITRTGAEPIGGRQAAWCYAVAYL
jgi:predicted XRE-type DNA-binding protein